MAGYSGTPLEKKLGIKPEFDVAFVNAPDELRKATNLPPGVKLKSISSSKDLDFIHVFVKNQNALTTAFEYSRKTETERNAVGFMAEENIRSADRC